MLAANDREGPSSTPRQRRSRWPRPEQHASTVRLTPARSDEGVRSGFDNPKGNVDDFRGFADRYVPVPRYNEARNTETVVSVVTVYRSERTVPIDPRWRSLTNAILSHALAFTFQRGP